MENNEIQLTVKLTEMGKQVVITFPFDLREYPEGALKSAATFVGQGIQRSIESMHEVITSFIAKQPDHQKLNAKDCEVTECIIRFTRVGKEFMLDMTPLAGFDQLTNPAFKAFCEKIRDMVAAKLDEVYKQSDGKAKKIAKTVFGRVEQKTDEQLKDALWAQRN